MQWQTLISNRRLGQTGRHTERHDERSEFKRDYDRLIFSAPFRRLQNKTQVFPLPGSIFVHNRLTHSLEVASVGMSLGSDVARHVIANEPELAGTRVEELGTIVSTACLAHDLGNPPFGHSGEKAIQTFFTENEGARLENMLSPQLWCDLTHFEGNANAFRLLTHRYSGRRIGGFVMTYSMLASIVKYPFASSYAGSHGKFGFFNTEAGIFRTVADALGMLRLSAEGDPLRYARHPLVYLVEAADDICYEVMDIEDAHKLKLLSFEETRSLLLDFFEEDTQRHILQRIETENITDINEQVVYMRACVIGKLENECAAAFINNEPDIMNGTFKGSLIEHIPERQRNAYRRCSKVAVERIYRSKPVLDVELAGYRVMTTLMEQLVDAAVNPGRFYSQQLLRRVSSQYEIDSSDLETRVMAVVDFISGMTDVFALDFYQKLNGTSLPIV
ncbi:MAG: dNTP triphosphohydrolase [Prevotellaceae bacterium]|nr:dNTP triphosphohydrolase [Prevotellaceae bacterium]MDO4931506.1 dNTP triphosphohydrolase [Prevotellaceae bacterium]